MARYVRTRRAIFVTFDTPVKYFKDMDDKQIVQSEIEASVENTMECIDAADDVMVVTEVTFEGTDDEVAEKIVSFLS